MNPLTELLKKNGCIGSSKTMHRTDAARALGVSVRDITFWGRDSRVNATQGGYENVVCFSKKGIGGGLYLAADPSDVGDVQERLRIEAVTLFREWKGLKRAMSVDMSQQDLFEEIQKAIGSAEVEPAKAAR